LHPGKSSTVQVLFDPSQKVDRVSGELTGKLHIFHADHPQRDVIDLVGEVCFPNIKLDSTMVNFGSILTETSKKIVISMSNVSEMGINYEWSFIEEELATFPVEKDVSSDGRVESRNSIRDK